MCRRHGDSTSTRRETSCAVVDGSGQSCLRRYSQTDSRTRRRVPPSPLQGGGRRRSAGRRKRQRVVATTQLDVCLSVIDRAQATHDGGDPPLERQQLSLTDRRVVHAPLLAVADDNNAEGDDCVSACPCWLLRTSLCELTITVNVRRSSAATSTGHQ